MSTHRATPRYESDAERDARIDRADAERDRQRGCQHQSTIQENGETTEHCWDCGQEVAR